jgi:hypothetical protein
MRKGKAASQAWNQVLEMDLVTVSRDQNNFNTVRSLFRFRRSLPYTSTRPFPRSWERPSCESAIRITAMVQIIAFPSRATLLRRTDSRFTSSTRACSEVITLRSTSPRRKGTRVLWVLLLVTRDGSVADLLYSRAVPSHDLWGRRIHQSVCGEGSGLLFFPLLRRRDPDSLLSNRASGATSRGTTMTLLCCSRLNISLGLERTSSNS